MTFDLLRGEGTGSVYYDGWPTYSLTKINSALDTNLCFQFSLVTIRGFYGRAKALSVKLCKIEGSHFDFEMATTNILRDAVGGNEETFVTYGFPHIVSIGYLDKQPMIIYPRMGMSLQEKIDLPVDLSKRREHIMEMLTIVYTVVRFKNEYHSSRSAL